MLWSISLGPRFECFGHLPIGLGKEYSTNAALEQCSQLSSPSVFWVARDWLLLIVRFFGGAWMDYAREIYDWKDCRGL